MKSNFRLDRLPLLFLAFYFSGLAYGQNDFSQQSVSGIERVTGIGGFFIRTDDPNHISEWYEKNLGVTTRPESYEDDYWHQEEGPTVFAPFQNDTEYFGRPSQTWMINFRVKDLNAMVDQLEKAGIEVIVDEKEYPNGRFARLYDPEGNPIELWEPKTSD
jgi:predicted enzyme related to lactoylglutathione lyase